MDRKLDLKTRRLLVYYRALTLGRPLDVIAHHARAAGRALVRLRNIAPLPARTAA
jgi:hypothetical protein